jgi:hypothetical protein
MFVLPVAVSGRNPGSGSFDCSLFTAANLTRFRSQFPQLFDRKNDKIYVRHRPLSKAELGSFMTAGEGASSWPIFKSPLLALFNGV